MTGRRLLHLGFAFPPGLSALHPAINPAGHNFESRMIAALRAHFDIRSAGMLPFPISGFPANADPASGIAHDLLLVDQAPELWHRMQALRELKKNYLRWQNEKWIPDAILVYNLAPVYNQFIRWLRRQPQRPRLVLLLLDSAQLGSSIPAWTRFRYKFKPFVTLDEDMLDEYDACIGLSPGVEKHTAAHQLPMLWMPGACSPNPPPPVDVRVDDTGPVRFCNFGALAAHAGALELTRAFLQTPGTSELHISGYGRHSGELAELAKSSARIHFHGLLPKPEECLRLGQSCDVLVNPRPPGFGNENNMPSKLFDYALCARAILTSRHSGAEAVLGPEAFYFETDDYVTNLRRALERAAGMERVELHRRGASICERVKREFNWPRQAERMAEFIFKLT
ncbi:MAG: hypothetical protein JWQ04_1520 [Pedosphaera sp.]|nr:hypothetical protein [Pedosphaera sp.]